MELTGTKTMSDLGPGTAHRGHCVAGLLLVAAQAGLLAQSSPDLAQQIAEVMAQGPSGKAHQRYIHAKGIVCKGTFEGKRLRNPSCWRQRFPLKMARCEARKRF
jgi:hypothetical protein